MKYSGIDWIGEIPDDWKLNKIGQLFNLRNEKVSDKDYSPLSVSKGGIVPQMENVAKSDASDDRKLVLKGDFAINSRSDRKMSCGISPLDGSVSLINTILYPKDDAVIYNDYMNYLLKNYGFAEEFYRWGHGIVADLWTTKWQEMKNIMLPLPSVHKQKAIYDFLNQKIAEIDSLIEIENQQIEKLKEYKQVVITEAVIRGLDKNVAMKDSGIKWIGMIPETYKIKKIKYVADIVRGGSPRPIEDYISNTDEGYNWIKIGDTEKGNRYINHTKQKIVESGLSKTRFVHKNDLILTNSMSFGEPYILNIDGCIHDGWLAFCNYKDIDKIFLYYCLQSNLCMKQFAESVAGGIVQNLNIDKVKDSKVFIPPMKEQIEIIDYLDNKMSDINKLILIKQKKIEKLDNYKKSLIYEYVTGKKDVC